ncbi:MAG: type II secretion system protein [Pirellulaceae bacterium]
MRTFNANRTATNMMSRRLNRQGLTLLEILVAMVMTLIVLGAMMYAFRYASSEIAKGRAMIELSNQLRMVQEDLRADLEGVTVDMRPWAITASPNGYFEYIEGEDDDRSIYDQDKTARPMDDSVNGIIGDFDDILAMTTRANGREFRGRRELVPNNPQVETSQIAEVIWWTDYNDRDNDTFHDYDEPIQVYRRVLLVRPDLNAPLGHLQVVNSIDEVYDFFRINDVSARLAYDANAGNWKLYANSLEDLSKRENRFAHWALSFPSPPTNTTTGDFPHELRTVHLQNCEQTTANLTGLDLRYAGGDIRLSEALSFDVRVFSPDAPIQLIDNIAVSPGDIGFINGAPDDDKGAFVDLGYNDTSSPQFDPTEPEFSEHFNFAGPDRRMRLQHGTGYVLDTFSKHYESNGIDDDGRLGIDQGIDGIDNDGTNGVDDNNERETLPPYPFRIRGIEVRLRVVERNTQQVRQTSVVHSFMPR